MISNKNNIWSTAMQSMINDAFPFNKLNHLLIIEPRKVITNNIDDIKKQQQDFEDSTVVKASDGNQVINSQTIKPIKPMRHVEKALLKFAEQTTSKTAKQFIYLDNIEDIKGVAPQVRFTIQSDPIGEVGINGCQANDMLLYVKCLFESLNEAFPCNENYHTLGAISQALAWQEQRTKDREKRNVEGKNQS